MTSLLKEDRGKKKELGVGYVMQYIGMQKQIISI